MRLLNFYLAILAAFAVSARHTRIPPFRGDDFKPLLTPFEDTLCSKPTDIVFVLDSSSAVTQADFKKELGFVSTFLNGLETGPDKIQVGVVTFSSDAKSELKLNEFSQKQDIQAAISKIRYRGGSTNTWIALQHVQTESFTTDNGGRVGVPKIVVIITAGSSSGKSKTLDQAKLLHKDPLQIIMVPVGNNVDSDEQKAIASKPENIYQVSDFDSLPTIEDKVVQNFCKKGEIFCSNPSDVVFVLDSSASVTQADFKKEIGFVNSLVKDMSIGQSKIQVGVVTFSSDVKSEFELNEFSQKQEIQAALSKIAYRRGSTNTWLALQHIRTDSFTVDHGGRVGVPKVVIFVTAGSSNGKSKTLDEAKLLHKDPLRIYMVAIGGRIDPDEQNAIVSKPQYLFKAASFDSLSTIKASVKQSVCKKVCGVVPSDIIFVADESTSIWDPDYKKQIDFIVNFVKDTVVGRNSTQIGMVSFSTNVVNRFNLRAKPSRAAVISSLQHLKQLHGDTYTAKALEYVRTQGFSTSNGGRPNVPHIIIVITDGQSTTPHETRKEAAKLAQDNIIAFTIGVGKRVDLNELKSIAGDDSRVFEVANYDTLHTIEKKLFAKVCTVEIGQL
ncbi:collagen alpha-4(VI) chain-like [Argonauta hians]